MTDDAKKMWDVLSTSANSLQLRDVLSKMDLINLAKLLQQGIISQKDARYALLGEHFASEE